LAELCTLCVDLGVILALMRVVGVET